MNGSGSALKRITTVVVICALVGALAGIAGSAAAPSKQKATAAQKAKAKAVAKAKKKAAMKGLKRAGRRGPGGPGFFLGGPGGPGGPGGGPVHSETVVPNEAGDDFITITSDAGKLTSVDGSTLNIAEGTDKKKYKDVSIDVGSSPVVIRNHKDAKLSDLKADDHVRVIQGTPKGTIVIAEDDAFLAQEKKEHEGFGFGHRGHRGPPPPGAPAPPGDDQGSNENGADSGSSSSGSNS
jgi:hypothetical protein